MKRRALIMLILISMAFSFLNVSAAYGYQDIRVRVNGQELSFDVAPLIRKGRVLVPFRAIFEALGVRDIEWNQRLQQVIASIDDIKIQLRVNSDIAKVNGEDIRLDTSVINKNGRVLVPIRFVSETLGYYVKWYDIIRTVIINSSENTTSFSNDLLGVKLNMGDKREKVIELLGEPDRIDKSGRIYDWYIYNDPIAHYVQIGVLGDRIVAFATNSSHWVLNDHIRIGNSKEDLEAQYGPIYNFMDIRDNSIYFIWDEHENNSLSSMKVEEEYYPVIEQNQEVANSLARQAFDLTNVLRIRNGKEPLKWDDKLAQMALYHSKDMAEKGYFSHVSLNGDSLEDRAKKFGIKYFWLGENIVMGIGNDAMLLVGSLYNSGPHRENMLNNVYDYLGIGVAFEPENEYGSQRAAYLTQNFLME
ncbi:MAG: hypothetical protein GXY88_02215 [Tissierellia bacterium]|nr:hypothetical protein [Tissierellia bacterium]